MASNIARVDSVAKTVQELATTVTNPPEKYILKNGTAGGNITAMEVPVIDITLLTSSSPQGTKEIEKLWLAFSSCGYIQALNHGIEDSFLEEVHDMSKEFFSLPMEEKMKCARPLDDVDGYGNDTVYSEKQTIDWNDRLFLNVKPESKRKLKVWPENPANFSEMVVQLTAKIEKMNEIMLRAIAKSLELKDEDCFVKLYGENPKVLARFNYYPPCPRPDAVAGAKAHADASAMTYLLQDRKVEGLQTLKDGQWYRVPIIHPNAILVNIGDLLEIMSNGIFKSPIHRVVTNPDKERITVALFWAPDPMAEVGPSEDLIDDERPRLFKNLVGYANNIFKSLQEGKRHIDLFRV